METSKKEEINKETEPDIPLQSPFKYLIAQRKPAVRQKTNTIPAVRDELNKSPVRRIDREIIPLQSPFKY